MFFKTAQQIAIKKELKEAVKQMRFHKRRKESYQFSLQLYRVTTLKKELKQCRKKLL